MKMWSFLKGMFYSPESHPGAYEWALAFSAHFGLGLLGWITAMLVFNDPVKASIASFLIYFLGWEASQFLMKRTLIVFLDSIVDSIAWASMNFALYHIWEHELWKAAGYAFGTVFLLMIGICRRLKC